MPGEIDLSKLIQEMKPELNPGEFIFCQIDSSHYPLANDAICFFQEKEGLTLILPKQKADEAKLLYSGTYAWITLTIHSSLEAVGLTAAVSQALAQANISCNIVAAYYHDHLFVPLKDAQQALDVLQTLTQSA